jgi:hypothetical protein
MSIKLLQQQLATRNLPTHGLKHALLERLQQAMQQDEQAKDKKISNEAFREGPTWPLWPRKSRRSLEARLAVARAELEAARTEVCSAQRELKKLEPRLSFNPQAPDSVLLSTWISSERKLADVLLE